MPGLIYIHGEVSTGILCDIVIHIMPVPFVNEF